MALPHLRTQKSITTVCITIAFELQRVQATGAYEDKYIKEMLCETFN